MSRTRVLSNCQALYVGPAPSTGYHFIDDAGNLNDNYQNLMANNNLLKEISRVTNVTYQINYERTEVKHLGKRGLVAHPAITPPAVTVSFDYMLMGLRNEARLGFNVNYSQFQTPFSGQPFYNYLISPISGFVTRSFTTPSISPYWPRNYRDDRNIFVAIDKGGNDIHNEGLENLGVDDSFLRTNVNVNNFYVVGFGNCRMNSYKTEAAINSFPHATVSYVAENMNVILSGSGAAIPAVNTKDFSAISGVHFVIPEPLNEGGPAVLNPGDITLQIYANRNVYGNVSGYLTGFFAGNLMGAVSNTGGSFYPAFLSGNVTGNYIGQVSGYLTTGFVNIPVNNPASIYFSNGSFFTQLNPTLYSGNISGTTLVQYQIVLTGYNNLLQSNVIGYVTGIGTGNSSNLFASVTGLLQSNFTGVLSKYINFPVSDLMIDTNDIKIQSYSLDLSFIREPLNSLGYKLPVDRKINFPVYANLSFGVVVGDDMTGNLVNQFNRDDDYNLSIQLKNPTCSVDFGDGVIPPIQEPQNAANQIAIQYDLIHAKFQTISFQSAVNQSKLATFNFSVEVDPDDLSHGLFMSGLLNINKVENYWIDESGNYLVGSNNDDLIVSNYPVLY